MQLAVITPISGSIAAGQGSGGVALADKGQEAVGRALEGLMETIVMPGVKHAHVTVRWVGAQALIEGSGGEVT